MTAIVVGVIIGLFFGGPLGALFGGAVAWWLTSRNGTAGGRGPAGSGFNRQRAQSAFFNATFLVMGRLAKADGRVSETEIEMASAIMNEMRLSPDQRKAAIELFNRGKQPSADISDALQEFRRVAGATTLLPMFMEILLQAAYADGALTQSERAVFKYVCEQLGVNQLTFDLLHKRFQAQRAYYQSNSSGGGWSAPGSASNLSNAYDVLGVESSASDAEVKRAYRKLMSQHHPDKLVAKGLPEEMMEVAKQKAQEIQAAYDQIKEHRKNS